MGKIITLILFSMLASCGLRAPAHTDWTISGPNLLTVKVKKTLTLTPTQATRYICRKSSDFLNQALYLITLEKNLATCNQNAVLQPSVVDCTIFTGMLYCGDGTTLTWLQAQKYICNSPTDFLLLSNYRKTLIQDIAACKPAS